MKAAAYKNLLITLVFGILTGIVLATAAAVFVPRVAPEWTGALVCPGRLEYVSFRQSYYCFTGGSESFDAGDAMFWAIFRRFVLLGLAIGLLAVYGLLNLGRFLYRRREAAGF